MQKRLYYIATCGLYGCITFFHIIPKTALFSQKKFLNIKCVLFFYAHLSKIFLIIRIIKRNIFIKVCRSFCTVLIVVLIYEWKFNFLDIFSKIIKHEISWNFVQREPECFMRTDRQKERYSYGPFSRLW